MGKARVTLREGAGNTTGFAPHLVAESSPPAWLPLPPSLQAANTASSRSNPEAANVARPPGPLTADRPLRTASVASGRA